MASENILQNLTSLRRDPQLQALQVHLMEFNLFRVLRRQHKEHSHSDIIAWLLRPNENHGLGSSFLQAFIGKVGNREAILRGGNDWSDTQVQREKDNIDVLVWSNSNQLVCVVENKVWSEERKNQLKKYRDLVESRFPGWKHIFVYLSPQGKKPSDNTYLPMSYQELAELVEEVLHKIPGTESRALFLKQYYETLRRCFMGDPKASKVCEALLSKHWAAVKHLMKYLEVRDELKAKTVENLLRKQGVMVGDQGSLPSSKTLIRFVPNELDSEMSNCPIPKKEANDIGWDGEKAGECIRQRVLFEFDARFSAVGIQLVVGRSKDAKFRKRILAMAHRHPDVFEGLKEGKYIILYWKDIMSKDEYQKLAPQEIGKVLEPHIRAFFKNYPRILKAFQEEFS